MFQGIDDLIEFSPLTKTFTFNAYLVSGFTPITKGSKLDYDISRPDGMNGYILNLTLRGEGRIKAGGHYFSCRQGDILLFPPGVPHEYGRASNSKHWDHLWVYFIARPHWIEYLNWDDNIHNICKTTCESTDLLAHIRGLFYKILQFNASDELNGEAYAMNTLELLLLDCFKMQPLSNRQGIDQRVEKVCQYINANILVDISIETLAKRVFLSPSRLAHLFREEMNDTIYSWREKQRISQARNLLQHTKFSISSIGQMIGYGDAVYFSRIFRKHNGISATEYRKHYENMKKIQ